VYVERLVKGDSEEAEKSKANLEESDKGVQGFADLCMGSP